MSTTTTTTTLSEPILPLSSASLIASHAVGPTPPNPYHTAIELSQATHRINLLNTPAWSPFFQSSTPLRILELGCGQGTCTAVLASIPSQSGVHITAVDPAPLSYGAPYTLGQAQSHLSAGPLGNEITFHRSDPVEFLTNTKTDETAQWDVAVLAHCIWYFRSPETLGEILAALKGRVKAVCVAEYALHASEKAAVPHVLAALARAGFEAHRVESQENVQNVLSPAGVKGVAEGKGWKVKGEGVVVPGEGLSDGGWEVGTVVDGEFLEGIEKEIGDGGVRAFLTAARDAVVASVEGVGGVGKVRTMDVWVGSFVEE